MEWERVLLFVTVEGIEGSGKSTLLNALVVRMREVGMNVVATREPGGTLLGNRLRALFVDPGSGLIDALAEAMLLNASRAQLVREIIAPALKTHHCVLCDRYTHATLAYQGYGRGFDLATLRMLADLATQGITPDLTLLIDIPVEVSRKRVADRSNASGESLDRMEREEVAFHARVRDGYLTLANENPRMMILDGMLDPDGLLNAAWRAVEPCLS